MGKPLRVLIVEDSEEDTLLIVRELKRGGFDPIHERVETAKAMTAALESQSWDIVISDYVMPHFSGLEALKLLKASGLDLPFIIVSGSIGEEVAVEAMKSGAHDYLMKNNLTRLVPAIQQELREAEVRQKLMVSQNALQQSEKRYRQVVENATEIIYSIDTKGNFTYGNPAGLKVTGYSLAELRSFNYADLVLPEHRERVMEIFINQFSQMIPTTHVEFPFFCKTGKVIWFSQNSSLVIEDGKVVGFHMIARDITERKRAEEALRKAEENFRRSLDDSPLGVRIVTTEGETIYANRTILDIYGYDSIEELRTTPIKKRYTPESYAEFQIRKEKRQRGEYYPPEYEISIMSKNGEIRDLQVFRKEVFWNGGRQFQTVYQDITERKKAEDALRESEERFRELYDNAPVGYFEYGTQGRITSVNRTELEMLGYTPEEMIGQPVWKFIVEEEIARQQILAKLAGTMPPARGLERTYRRKDGTAFPAIVEDRLILDSEGKIKGIRATIQDITERKQAEEAIRISEEKYRTIIENIEDGYFEVDIAGNFTFYNDSLCRILGYSRDEMIDMNNRQYTDQENAKKLFKAFNRVYRTGESTKELDWGIIGKDGARRHIEASVSLIKDSSGNRIGFRGLVRDVTERKRAEEEREKMQAQLIQAQKMESIGTLAGGVAHDFNNLLTTIQGYAQLAMMSLKESDPFYENFKEIRQASVRAANLTRQLLLFSRQQAMDLNLINLNATVGNLMKMLRRLIGEDITIQTDLDPNLWMNMADAGNMEQVIMNLVVNARDAMPEGKNITVKTENVDIDEGYCEIYKYAHPGKFVCLSVEDTGVGMDKEIIQHIFDPFFTTKGIGRGTGLGLSVVYGIVKQHEGWINVYSEPGRGSVFKVYLPASSVESKDETKKAVISIQDYQGKSERILLVEDDDGIREFAKRVLVESGYVGFEAANAEEALNIFGKEKGNFHLVFTDVVLPGKSGIQLVEQLLSRTPELKVLLTSGYTDQKSQWSIIREKGYPFIQKPYGLTDLLRVVKEVIEQ